MIIINKDQLLFGGTDGEMISVVVKSMNTNHMVTFNLDGVGGVMNNTGPASSRLDFRLDQSQHDPSQLVLTFHYSSADGGMYRVFIRGDQSSDTFGDVFRQEGVPVDASMFLFDVL